MNPAKINISDCHLDDPVKKSSGKISFCLLPCLHNTQRLQVKLQTKFKIFAHQEESFSLGITLSEDQIQFFKDLETDKSEQEKIYAKISLSKLPNSDFSCRFWELCDDRKKKPILRQKQLINIPLRGQVVFSIKHLFCGNAKAITCIVDEVLVEEMVQEKSAFDEFEDRNEDDE